MRIFLLALLFCGQLFAAAPVVGAAQLQLGPGPDVENAFNKLQGVPAARKYALGTILRQAYNTLVCVYDFATQGGAISTIGLLSTDLRTACTIPGKSVIRNGFVDVTTSPTSGGSPTIAIGSGAATNDLLAATAIGSFGAGQYLLIPRYATVGTFIKLSTANVVTNGVNTNAYQPTMTIATATLTAGHFRVFIDYSLSE
jgi:hypothetical protein